MRSRIVVLICATTAYWSCGGDSKPSAPALDDIANVAEEIIIAPDSLTASVKWKNISSTELASGVEVEQSFAIEFNNLLDYPMTFEVANLEIIDGDEFLLKTVELNRKIEINAKTSITVSIIEKVTYNSVAVANNIASFRVGASIYPFLNGSYFRYFTDSYGRSVTILSFGKGDSYSEFYHLLSLERLSLNRVECKGTYGYVKPQIKVSGRCSNSAGQTWDLTSPYAVELYADRLITSWDEEFVGTSDLYEFRRCGESCDDELADFNKWLAEKEQLEAHAPIGVVGLIIRGTGGAEIVRNENGQVSGEIEIGHGKETALLTVRFIAEDDNLFAPDTEDGFSLGWEIADLSIAEVDQQAEDGAWNFRIVGLNDGKTTLRLKIIHEDHADFVSSEIKIHVSEVMAE